MVESLKAVKFVNLSIKPLVIQIFGIGEFEYKVINLLDWLLKVWKSE